MIKAFLSGVALLSCLFVSNNVHAQQATNPLIFADVPDMSMIRVGKNYYMSSTTMQYKTRYEKMPSARPGGNLAPNNS